MEMEPVMNCHGNKLLCQWAVSAAIMTLINTDRVYVTHNQQRHNGGQKGKDYYEKREH